MSENWTPGKWRVVTEELGESESVRIVSDTAVVALCKAAGGRKIANAHMMAAAPEMFEALRKAEQRIEQLCSMVNTLSGNPRKVRGADFSEPIRTALAKARGL